MGMRSELAGLIETYVKASHSLRDSWSAYPQAKRSFDEAAEALDRYCWKLEGNKISWEFLKER